MLVLSRHVSEDIIVEGPCVIKVVQIRGDKVRLGINAEKDVKIYRREVAEAIAREKEAKGQ